MWIQCRSAIEPGCPGHTSIPPLGSIIWLDVRGKNERGPPPVSGHVQQIPDAARHRDGKRCSGTAHFRSGWRVPVNVAPATCLSDHESRGTDPVRDRSERIGTGGPEAGWYWWGPTDWSRHRRILAITISGAVREAGASSRPQWSESLMNVTPGGLAPSEL